MNGKEVQSDSLLSNISNISVKIDHNRNDGSGFFHNFVHNNQFNSDQQKQQEVMIDALQDQQSFNPVSLLNQINMKNKQYFFPNGPENTWVTGKNAKGLSENQQDSSESIALDKPIKKQENQYAEIKEQSVQMEEQQKNIKFFSQKKLKNETKNIPKNYGKAIISFIQKYEDKVRYITKLNGVDFEEFVNEIKDRKKTINTIADLRNMWIQYKYAKCMRLLSNLFLRKYALSYIFNSRICNFGSHIKYRYRLCEAIRQPFSFKHIKDY